MIYFNDKKEAFGYEIENYIATIDDDIWQNYAGTDKWDIIDGEFRDITETEEYKQKEEQKEREILNKLFLTAADVERAIYKVKNIDFDDIVELVKENTDIDLKALKIELKANNFYRGNPYIDLIGNILGFTSKQLDNFFKTGDYTKLCNYEETEND